MAEPPEGMNELDADVTLELLHESSQPSRIPTGSVKDGKDRLSYRSVSDRKIAQSRSLRP
jgi:hypothetical protein